MTDRVFTTAWLDLNLYNIHYYQNDLDLDRDEKKPLSCFVGIRLMQLTSDVDPDPVESELFGSRGINVSEFNEQNY